MDARYLEISYRNGKAFAAYLYLDRRPEDSAHRTEKAAPGLLVDYAADGHIIGIEITALAMVSADEINELLRALHLQPLEEKALSPLSSAY